MESPLYPISDVWLNRKMYTLPDGLFLHLHSFFFKGNDCTCYKIQKKQRDILWKASVPPSSVMNVLASLSGDSQVPGPLMSFQGYCGKELLEPIQ